MQPRRFDGSTDWVAPARTVEVVATPVDAHQVPAIQRAALMLLGLLAALALALSLAAQAS